MAMKKLKKIGVLSLAKFQGIMMALMGLLIGLMAYLLQALLLSTSSAETPEAQIAASFGPLAIIFFPVAYGIMGFIMGSIVAALYNLISRFVGGIEVEFKD